ncbi:thioesterase domain-containing protein, partial [Bacteroidota bacterium]
ILATIPFGLDPSKLPISIEQAAEIYVADLLKISASEEYTLIGYSMGGLLASEICYLLEQAGKKIKHLYLLDSYHPKAIVKIVNHNTLNARSHFYTNKFIKANTTEKLLLLKYFLYFFYTRTKKLKTKTGRLSFILRPLVLIGIMSRTEKLCKTFGNKNFELAVKYNSKKIASQVVLILATDNNESYNYCNQTSSLSENILYFKNEVSEQINYYKVPFSHTSLLEIENIKTVTNIINEHISS